MPKQFMFSLALLLAACVAPAFAQEAAKAGNIVLETRVGSVMTSTGGDYQSAAAGKQLVEGESMMLNEGATAKVVYYYDNGQRKCVENYAGPNTYVIDDSCNAAALLPLSSRGTALIIGGALVATALLASGGSDNNTPQISAGAR